MTTLGAPVRYEVRLENRVQHLVEVRMVVPADVAAGARLVVPTWTPGSYLERDYVHHLQSMTAHDESGEPVGLTPLDRTSWRIDERAEGCVTIDLEWYAHDLTVRTSHVDDHHALLVPPSVLPYVESATDRPHEVTVVPTEGHATWGLLPTSDGLPDGRREPTTYVADDTLHLIDSAFEVGDFPSTTFEIDGIPHRWVHATHAGHIDLDRVESDIRAISEQARHIFDDTLPIESYTFLCVGEDPTTGAGGLEHRDGAVLQLPAFSTTNPDGIDRSRSLIAHEYFHLWNVKRLVPAGLVEITHDRPTHTEQLWVAEGWTAYYDDLLLARAGLRTARAYLDHLAADLTWTIETPGASRQSVTAASWHAWTGLYVRDENSANAGTNYYVHGAVLAACLDMLIRQGGSEGGLDEAMGALWRRFGHPHTHGYPKSGYSGADVRTVVSDAAGRDLTDFFDAYVRAPALPPLEELLSTVGLRVDTGVEADANPDLGVAVSEEGDGFRLTAVLRDRPAWAAGISGGDRLVSIDGLVVRRGELERVLAGLRPGHPVEVAVRRGTRLLEFEVELGDPRPTRRIVAVEEPTESQQDAFARWCGHPLSTLDAPGKG